MQLASSEKVGVIVNGEIQDSWETIIKTIHKGKAQKYYSVGNWKTLDMGSEGQIRMELIGFDKDTRSDGTGKAPTTWAGIELLKTKVQWTNTSYGSSYSGTNYRDCYLRHYYQTVVKPMMPDVVKNNLVTVSKRSSSMSGAVTTNEEVWTTTINESGHINEAGLYYPVYAYGNDRVKKCCYGSTTKVEWWLRDVQNNGEAQAFSKQGADTDVSFSTKLGVPLFFCL